MVEPVLKDVEANVRSRLLELIRVLKAAAREKLSPGDVDEALARATRGLSHIELAYVLDHGDELCEKCGDCCRVCDPIAIMRSDVARLCFCLGVSREIFIANFTKEVEGRLSLKTRPCPFLRGNLCSVYPYRPKICRTYPLTEEGGLIGLAVYSHCSLAINVMARKALGYLLRRLMEMDAPDLDKEMQGWAKDMAENMEGKDQLERILLGRKIVDALQVLEESHERRQNG